MSASSSRTILSSGLVAEVEHCATCEIIHLHLGAFTLRLKPAVLLDLRDTLDRALAAMPLQDNGQPAHYNPRAPGGSCH